MDWVIMVIFHFISIGPGIASNTSTLYYIMLYYMYICMLFCLYSENRMYWYMNIYGIFIYHFLLLVERVECLGSIFCGYFVFCFLSFAFYRDLYRYGDFDFDLDFYFYFFGAPLSLSLSLSLSFDLDLYLALAYLNNASFSLSLDIILADLDLDLERLLVRSLARFLIALYLVSGLLFSFFDFKIL